MRSSRSVDRSRTGMRRRVGLVGATGIVLLTATACSAQDIPPQLSIPKPVTDQGETIYSLWNGVWVAAWVIGGITAALILGSAFVFRRRSDAVPAQTRYNIPIEVLYTVTPFIIIAVVFFFTARDESKITAIKNDNQQTVNVVGYQWSWAFNYLDAAGKPNVYDVGTPTNLPTLWLPVDEKVKFILSSPDVAHSFWVPQFLFKMDVIPGRYNQFELTPTVTGEFAGRCAELCGTYHSQMLFRVKVVTAAEFDAHLAELRAAGQTGALQTGRANDDAQDQGRTVIGQNPQSPTLGSQQ